MKDPKQNLKTYQTKVVTQSEYARRIGKTRTRVNQMIKEGKLDTVTIAGNVLVKIS